MAGTGAIRIRSMRRNDVPAVKHLWSERFGGDPTTQQNWIDAALDPTHSAAGFAAGDGPDDEVVGASFMDVGSRAYTRQYLGLDVLDRELPLSDRNGLFHLSCVRADAERRGIGSAFYERRLTELAARSVPRAHGISWHRPHTVDSRVLFEKYGFTCVVTIEHYYRRTDERPHCPDCGDTCSCTASLYTRRIAR